MKVRDPRGECRHDVSLFAPCRACDEELPRAALVPPGPCVVQAAAYAYLERTGTPARTLLVHPRDVVALFDRAAQCGNYQPDAPAGYSGLIVVQLVGMRRGTQVLADGRGHVTPCLGKFIAVPGMPGLSVFIPHTPDNPL